jgi:hypothetical protein
VDRIACERGIEAAYELAGLVPPRRVEWCLGPVAIERSRASGWHSYNPGPSVRKRLIDDVLTAASRRIEESVPAPIRFPVKFALGFGPQVIATHAAIMEAVSEAVRRLRPGAMTEIRLFARWLAGYRRIPYADFAVSCWAQHDARGWLAVCEYLHDVCGFHRETRALLGLWQIAANGGWVVPHERVCWVSERHDCLHLDARGRLHNSKGPALTYPDDWRHYAWKGVALPAWIIEHPDQITPALIDIEPSTFVRLCMIDIMTPERYVSTGAAVRSGADAAGTLWRKQWWGGDGWAAVEVVNGTPEPDGHHKHYFLQVPPEVRSPSEAVAWTYGLSTEAYAHLSLRT